MKPFIPLRADVYPPRVFRRCQVTESGTEQAKKREDSQFWVFENDAIEAAQAQRVTDICAFAGMPFRPPFSALHMKRSKRENSRRGGEKVGEASDVSQLLL